MDIERQAKDLFERALDVPPGERSAWLEGQCPPGPLRARVEALLQAHGSDPTTPWGLAGAGVPGGEGAAADDDRPAPPLPDAIGPYPVVRVLGRGGMGIVYLAREESLARFVAVKTLAEQLAGDPMLVARFDNEALAQARLNHASIVPIHRVGEDHGLRYIAMEYMPGGTLADLLEQEKAEGAGTSAPARLQRMARLVSRVAEGLDHAHQQDIIHRDVKPANILLDEEGSPRLGDFGIARIVDTTALTSTGQLAGTYRYMSPEQVRASRHGIDHRTDVFSLGIVLYECLTLTHPFPGLTVAQVLDAVVHRQPRRPRQVAPDTPVDLETICLKALEKSPEHRYQTAGHLGADLRAWLAGQPILARPPELRRRIVSLLRRRRVSLLSAALLLVALTAAGILWWQDRAHDRSGKRLVAITCDDPSAELWLRQEIVEVVPVEPVGDGATGQGAGRTMKRGAGFGPARRVGVGEAEVWLAPGLYRIAAVDGAGALLVESSGTVEGVDEPRDEASAAAAGAATPGPKAKRDALHWELVFEAPVPVTDEMVDIPAGRYMLGNPVREVELGAFAIDRFEVSNADYRRFVQAVGAEAPLGWPTPYDPAIDDLPVTGLCPADAEAYARWVGKRLPTSDEWEVAARWTPDGALMPGEELAQGLIHGPEDHHPIPGPLTETEATNSLRAGYLAHAEPVDASDSPEHVTAGGVHHLMTNVRELTETVDHAKSGSAVLRGADWSEGTIGQELTARGSLPWTARLPQIGFRCARSLSPPQPDP